MSEYDEYLVADARLVMLRELAAQSDGRLNEVVLQKVLDVFAHRRSRDWVRTQLLVLEDVGVVKTRKEGTVLVAAITQAGMDHVERRRFVEGVARPSLEV